MAKLYYIFFLSVLFFVNWTAGDSVCSKPKPPKINCNRTNEHYECGRPCQKTCLTKDQPCSSKKCVHGCYCNKGYVRSCSETDECVPECRCRLIKCAAPSTTPPPITCKKPHEHYACGSACQTECANLGKPCSIINVACNHACYCDEGYARNADKICIKIEDCPPNKS